MFIDFEGIDGAGTETWSKYSNNFFKAKGRQVSLYRYPDYNSPWGKIISDFLDGRIELETDIQFLTYSADILKDADSIRRDVSDKVVITDRYILSTMAYQCSKGFPVEKALRFYDIFEYPKPDYIVLLVTSSEISRKRKVSEHGKLDRHEIDGGYLDKVLDHYLLFSREKYISDKWVVIDTSGDMEETGRRIETFLNSII